MTLVDEKSHYAADVVHAEHTMSSRGSDVNDYDAKVPSAGVDELPEPDAATLKKALFKLDCIFLPSVTLIYFLSFLDRANIGNAKAAGLMEDLKLTDLQYSIALTVTYVPYIVAELPLTLLIRKM